jgi:hypothetical protein
MTGLFFCLASANGAGLLFCPATIQPHTSVYSAFCAVNAVIPLTPQNSVQGFIGIFPAICRVLPLSCGCASDYTAPPVPRWGASHRNSVSSVYPIPTPRRTLYRSAHTAYYNKVYKGAAYRRPRKPGGVSMLPTPGGLRSGTGSAVRAHRLAHSTRRSSPAAGTRRAARNH